METAPETIDPSVGLTAAQVEQRVQDGRVNAIPPAPSRTFAQILRGNVFTRFNALMSTLGAIVLIAGEPRDALFLGVVVVNTLVGTVQELRAKRTLDRLNLLNAPHAFAVRDGVVAEVDVEALVADEIVDLASGRQIVADGVVVSTNGLEVDESLLTGESDPIVKALGDSVRSGSFVVSGSGRVQVTHIGADSYAAKLAEEARRFTLVHSELRSAIDKIVTWVSWALIPIGVLLLFSQLSGKLSVAEALVRAVGGLVAMIPEGLVLLTSVAFALGVVRLAQRRTLVQELPAIEVLARVDVICLDKTGTLTEGSLGLADIVVVGSDSDQVHTALAALAHSDANPNPTQLAVQREYQQAPDWQVTNRVAFSSARKWSGASFAGNDSWVLGAPEMVVDLSADDAVVAADAADRGLRVLVLASTPSPFVGDSLPEGLAPAALLFFEDQVRPDAEETLAFFAAQGVDVKVISGDNPRTVGAVAARVGLETADSTFDARQLPADEEQLADLMDEVTVFGRVSPYQKRSMVKALQSRGHVVAMTGDGVNDVLALKDSDCGIAMASGSEATRSVAQLVLLDSSFSALPRVVAEGRRVINNIERVASLFLVKTTYAILIAASVAVSGIEYPFLPRQLTLIGTITIGAPAFILALAPNEDRVRPNFMARVLRFAVPGGIAAAAATMAGYLFSKFDSGLDLKQQQTVATIILTGVAVLMLGLVARPVRAWKLGLLCTVIGFEALVLITPFGRDYFDLALPDKPMLALCAMLIGGAAVLVIPLRLAFDKIAASRGITFDE